jgi:hypothetical protein
MPFLTNTTALQESMILNHAIVMQKIVELEEKLVTHIGAVEVSIAPNEIYDNSVYRVERSDEQGRYIVSITEEIARLLITPLGSRIMRPEYGSELYKLRDRELTPHWRLMAIRYTFVAINSWIDRIRLRKVKFELINGESGVVKMKLELEER